MPRVRKYVVCCVSVLLLLGAVSHANERYALLVGVDAYSHLDDKHQLRGPSNDVRHARDYLLHTEGFREANIYWLSDDDGAVPPERDNILGALEALDEKMRAGDFVLLHFSGHGSRQPARAGDTEELDGYDEIFLPADVGSWDDAIGSVENAITDNEIGAFIASYRSRGADVWLIADSCHSGTMTRGVGDDDVVERYVDPATFGIPADPLHGAAVSAVGGPQQPAFVDGHQGPESGMLVTFAAAHTTEKAPEFPLPIRGENSPVRGLLSYSIFEKLEQFRGVSYRQLAQLITDQYASLPWNRSTPQFYGSDMDRVVFNGSAERARLFAAEIDEDRPRLTIDAGTLRGFDMGAHVVVHRDARDVDDNLIGRGTVVTATATESEVDVKWDEGTEVPHHSTSVYVQLTLPSYSSQVVISPLDTKHDGDNRRLREIVAEVAPRVPLAEFEEDATGPDYYATFFDSRFWLLRRGQTLPCDVRPEIVTDDQLDKCVEERIPESLLGTETPDADSAATLVLKAARARMLTRFQEVVGLPGSLTIDVLVKRRMREEPVSRIDDPGPLHAGDKVFYRVRNDAGTAWDVFFFYVNSQLGIEALQDPGQSVRVLPGEAGVTELGIIDDSTVGVESLVVITEPVTARGGVESDYSFLEQLHHRWVVTRGRSSPTQETLEALWANEDSSDMRLRNMQRSKPERKSQIKVFTWTVVPG